VQDIKHYFEIYGTPIAAIRGRTTQDKYITRRDDFDSGLLEQVTMQEMVADIMHVAGAKFMVSLSSPLQIVLMVPTPSLSKIALGRALQQHIDLLRMFKFNARIVFVDPFKSLVGLRGTIPGVEVQATGAGDHLPKLDIRIRRIKEMARAVLNGLDYKLPLSFINQLITFCLSRINVMTTSSLTGNWCPRVRMTGRKVDFRKEYALTGDYIEARDPKVVSNSMEPRTEPCIALYPTLNVNGSWKMYSLVTKRIVSRSQFLKPKFTPENIINSMNVLASKGMIKASDIDQAEPVDIDEDVDEPRVITHVPDPNIVEVLEYEDDEEIATPDDDEVEEDEPTIAAEVPAEPNIEVEQLEADEEVEIQLAPVTRRSTRTTAGQTSKYEPYSMLTQGYGLACSNLRVKVALERFGKVAYDSIKEELIQLFVKKKALAHVLLQEFSRVNLHYPILRSHMFLREKFNAVGVFEKIKARLVADGSIQDREDFADEDVSSPTASRSS